MRQSIGTVTVLVTPGQPTNTFVPCEALGACVDGLDRGAVSRVYTPANIAAMNAVGFKPLSYRLRTELGVECWHWNSKGLWSDARRRQGYWTSNDRVGVPEVSHGYHLPHRGSTIDQANNDGYSRLDDGDRRTFWKSNPYLDSHFTGEANVLHPQWVVVDLKRPYPIDAIRICWAIPYATRYHIDYWQDPKGIKARSIDDTFDGGKWLPFPGGMQESGRGGDVVVRLCRSPISTRFVRIVMTESSERPPAGSRDVRDGLGYAIGELYIGRIDPAGHLHDLMRRAARSARQTTIYVSSTDPWHHAEDRDARVEQPGFDLVFRSGLTHGLPLFIPVGLLYDTPENAAAEIRYLKARGYPVRRVELGEEPDGQYVEPEDYGALFVQWARALHRVDPGLQLGGPGFQTQVDDVRAWPDRHGNRSWVNRFLNYLRLHGCQADLRFFSFEWYPFDNVCAPVAPQLVSAPGLLDRAVARWHREGLPQTVPWLITEYGYSSFAGQAEVAIEGALLDADIVGECLALGGQGAFLYGYEPNVLIKEAHCSSWGNLMLFLADDHRRIRCPVAAYHAARLMTQAWAEPSGGRLQIFQAVSDVRNARGQALITAYALQRSDRRWSLLLINKDPKRTWSLRVRFRETAGRSVWLNGPADLFQFSSSEYVWHPHGRYGYPEPDRSARYTRLSGHGVVTLHLPPYSLSVVRGYAF